MEFPGITKELVKSLDPPKQRAIRNHIKEVEELIDKKEDLIKNRDPNEKFLEFKGFAQLEKYEELYRGELGELLEKLEGQTKDLVNSVNEEIRLVKEIRRLAASSEADDTFMEEMNRLKQRGIKKILWSPPSVEQAGFSDNTDVALVGSASKFNREGLRWLESAVIPDDLNIRVYGGLSAYVKHPACVRIGRYNDSKQPYRDCGIIAVTTAHGMGVQIKTVEALAYGRAIVARKGAMRGFPTGEEPAWLEADDPQEMVKYIERLRRSRSEREEWAEKARKYYNQFLDSRKIKQDLLEAYINIVSDGQTPVMERK